MQIYNRHSLPILFIGPPDSQITPGQVVLLKEAIANTKEKLTRLASEHRDLHGTVSKVGKAIDRNFVSDFTATTRTDLLQSESNVNDLSLLLANIYNFVVAF